MKSETIILRSKKGRGFSYRYEKSDLLLTDKNIKEWIKSLAIPPAWTSVHINCDKKNKIHAWGRDSKDRKQYIYNQSWRAKREKEKFDHIVEFAQTLPQMRLITSKHLKEQELSRNKVLACMIRLMDNAYFRPGNSHYTAENDTYGLTTLRSKHLEISGRKIEFEYTGKAGKEQHRIVEDRRLASIVKKVDELPGYRIFKYIDDDKNICKVSAADLNAYIKTVMGEAFSAKDFRTWAGTYLASKLLSELEVQKEPKTIQKNLLKVIDTVAEKLGNTRTVAKANYIDPRVIDYFSRGITIKNYLKEAEKVLKKSSDFSLEEMAVLQLLNAKI